ncbi:MAG: citrate/2-methylcitrate synthase [Thermoanaerobaculales bacterium]|jgi:citrate synthase|nr:citrate/2-methylcitrate synthase [Thermoanaerobaculales bacterium]
MIGSVSPPSPQTYGPGLENLCAGDTRVGLVDGAEGRLLYRGYPVGELATEASFEETTYLILHGHLPTQPQLDGWVRELRRWRRPPRAAFAALERVPLRSHPLAQYRTMLTVAACHIPEAEDASIQAQWRRPARILSWTAALAAAAIRHLDGQAPLEPTEDLGFAANFLYQTLGRVPSDDDLHAFEASLIVQAEHGLHAAALAALVVASTGADLGSAVLAGMGALSGERHGGANQLAFEMMQPLEDPEHARRWAREALQRRHRFPGFGHRVYRCPDPRVTALEPLAEALLERHGLGERWQTYMALRDEVEGALGPRGIFANVDSITGLVYHPLGLPVSSFPIPFCLAIQTGWMAHCLEYLPDGVMIEPGAVYVGD